MSDVSQGAGWWQASDGKWYSPAQAPGPVPIVGPPYVAPPNAPPPYAAPPAYPSAATYGYLPGGAYGYPAVPRNNGLAIASMVCSFFFWVYGIPAVLAIIFGFIARSQIKRSNGAERGGGMALAGIIIGFVGIALGVVLVIVVVVALRNCARDGTCTVTTTS